MNLDGKIHQVLDEVLRDRIHLNVVQRHFDANRLNIDQLGPACRAAGGRALHAAQCRGTAHDQNLAGPTRDHLRQDRAKQPWQRIDERREGVAPLGI